MKKSSDFTDIFTLKLQKHQTFSNILHFVTNCGVKSTASADTIFNFMPSYSLTAL